MKEAYTRVGFEPLQKRRKKNRTVSPPQFGDLLSNFDLCRTASFVKQAESVPDLHKAFVFYVLLISNLQLNWRVALSEETKLSTYKNISRCTLRHGSPLCRPFLFLFPASGPTVVTLLSSHFPLVLFFESKASPGASLHPIHISIYSLFSIRLISSCSCSSFVKLQ